MTVATSSLWKRTVVSGCFPVSFCRQNCRHSFLTLRWWVLSTEALPTRTRWIATAFGETAGREELTGCWAIPSLRIRFQHLRLKCVKWRLAVVFCQRLRLAVSGDSIRWSAMSESPDASYSSSSVWKMQTGLRPQKMALLAFGKWRLGIYGKLLLLE